MDDTDRILIGALSLNARESVVSLARKVSLSRSATQERLARLERSGTIAGYTVRRPVNFDERSTVAFIGVSYLEGTKCAQVIPKIRCMPQVIGCDSLAGTIDLMLKVVANSTAELEQVRADVEKLSGVKATSTAVVLTSFW